MRPVDESIWGVVPASTRFRARGNVRRVGVRAPALWKVWQGRAAVAEGLALDELRLLVLQPARLLSEVAFKQPNALDPPIVYQRLQPVLF
jgi:hypothetical protein